MLFIIVVVYITALPMKEAYKSVILKRRAKPLGLPVENEGADIKRLIILKFIRQLHMLSTEIFLELLSAVVLSTNGVQPVIFFFSLYTGFAFAVLFLFFPTFPYVFMRPPYSFTTSQSGLRFISIGLGVLLGGVITIVIDCTIYQRRHRTAVSCNKANVDPEHRLYSAMIGYWAILIGLFLFVWCANKGVLWAPSLLGAIPFAWGNICVFVGPHTHAVHSTILTGRRYMGFIGALPQRFSWTDERCFSHGREWYSPLHFRSRLSSLQYTK
jgi:hypothetical protein